jgi:hypothetical protein
MVIKLGMAKLARSRMKVMTAIISSSEKPLAACRLERDALYACLSVVTRHGNLAIKSISRGRTAPRYPVRSPPDCTMENPCNVLCHRVSLSAGFQPLITRLSVPEKPVAAIPSRRRGTSFGRCAVIFCAWSEYFTKSDLFQNKLTLSQEIS